MTAAPIFIVGTERSGSNLLRLILNAHPNISVPHPPHIMAFFAPIEKHYGDLSRSANFERLTDDVLRHIHGHIHPWPVSLDRDRLIREADPRDLFGLFAAVYDQYLATTGKPRWGCKSTFMIHYVERIFARYPSARLIWLVRDPRDVVLSSRNSVFNPYHPFYTARLWAAQQELGLSLEGRLEPSTFRRVHYESLLSAPEATVAGICEFVREPFDGAMLRFFETPDARTSASLARDWRNTASPIRSGNFGKYAAGLSHADIALVESVTAGTMERLGYQPVASRRAGAPGIVDKIGYRLLNEIYRLRVEYRSLLEDRNQCRRWKRRIRISWLGLYLKTHAHLTSWGL